MPYISMFYGIIIRMFYNEHNPPHFHAQYQGQRGAFDFSGNMIAGNIRSKTALKLIKEWASCHAQELTANWQQAQQGQPLDRIDPLD